MEKKRYLECGKIVNTHGIRGEVKIQPWCDSPEFLKKFKTLYIDGAAKRVLSARVHKDCLIVLFDGVADVNEAMRLKNKIVLLDREDAKLPKGSYFIQDILGLPVYDEEKGELGILEDVLDMPAGKLYQVRGPKGEEHLIPAVPEFIREIDPEAGRITVKTIEGM